MSVNRPTTPLRRVSRGSISALSQSQRGGASSSSTPLSFLEGAMGNLADETSTLSTNLEDLASIHGALNTFNEGFSMFLYGLKVAAYCIEWSEAPQEDNFKRAIEREARSQKYGLQDYTSGGRPTYDRPASPDRGYSHAGYQAEAAHQADQTYMTMDEEPSFEAKPAPRTVLKSALKKPGTTATTSGATTSKAGAAAKGVSGGPAGARTNGTRVPSSTASNQAKTSAAAAGGGGAAATAKPKITLAQRKKREKYADDVVDTLPLEYRGSDPTARRLAHGVVMALIAAGANGAKINDIVKPPDLPQAKVNKCLIALSGAKHVAKRSNNGIVYALDPSRHPSLP
ncbi:unnamed protein product [Jaminaea pallidilutea]